MLEGKTATRATGGFIELVKTLVYAIAIALFIRTFLYEPFSIPSASMVPTLLVGDYLFVSKFSYGYSRYSLPYGYLVPVAFGSGPGRLFYRAPRRGDVVVFKLPCDYSRLEKTNPQEAEYLKESCSSSTDFIKRIVGLPGDHIQMRAGVLYINDIPVADKETTPFFYADNDSSCRTTTYPQFVETLPTDGSNSHDTMTHLIITKCGSPMLEDTPGFDVPPNHFFMMGDNRDDSADSRDATSGVGFVPAENLVGRAQFIFFSTSASLFDPLQWVWGIRYSRLFMGLH